MATPNKQKATIYNLETGESVTCQFNPGEYTIKKQNRWKQTAGKGKEVPSFEFSGGKPASLKMKLFFDTTDAGQDVRTTYTNNLWKMMKVGRKNNATGKGEPPGCRFEWGKTWSFEAVIKTINQKFTMFLGDGTPVRATLDVTFEQVRNEDDYPFQNPTSRSEPRKTRVVHPGDRLDLIAFEEYGDPNRWYDLAEANALEDPMALQSGQVLKIPILL